MHFDRSTLNAAIIAGDKRIANFLDTFGFVVIRNFLNTDDFAMISEEYHNQYKLRMPNCPDTDMQFLPNFVDSSKLFTEYFFGVDMQNVYQYFAGEKFLYLGSDGSQFKTTSFPWHRDWFTRMPIMKFNFYFTRHSFRGGKFMIIPGSNYCGDSYAANIQKAMSWPMQNKNAGGLNENGWLPETVNYRASLREQEGCGLYEVPHVELDVERGDLIIFDHRAVHCVQTTEPPVTRRLLTVLLSKNAFEFPDDHHLLKTATREDLMREVVDLVVSERNHIGCEPWGKWIYDHPFSKSDNFINIIKPDNCEKYVIGGFGEFKSFIDFNHYAAIGKAYREKVGDVPKDAADGQAQGYGYGDVHLGINAQNIIT